jgi:hypothetical protein
MTWRRSRSTWSACWSCSCPSTQPCTGAACWDNRTLRGRACMHPPPPSFCRALHALLSCAHASLCGSMCLSDALACTRTVMAIDRPRLGLVRLCTCGVPSARVCVCVCVGGERGTRFIGSRIAGRAARGPHSTSLRAPLRPSAGPSPAVHPGPKPRVSATFLTHPHRHTDIETWRRADSPCPAPCEWRPRRCTPASPDLLRPARNDAAAATARG